jgi:hypothetical protein
MSEITVALRLLLEGRQFASGLRGGTRELGNFSQQGRRHLSALNDSARGVRDTLAKLGLGVGAVALARQSGTLDKYLARIGQTADASKDQVEGLRKTVFALGRETGRAVEGIAGGFDTLIQKGLDYRSSLAALPAIVRASAVTGADEGVLAEALFVGGATFGLDLEKPGQAVRLLDEMYVAAKSGSAELEQLATIFGVSGDKAKSAGLDFRQTLSLIEELSLTVPKERLGNVFDSTLRLFTNGQYLKGAQKATGVPFFDKATGARRDPATVLADLARKYQALKNDKGRADFMSAVLGKTDIDTQTGIGKLVSEGALDKFNGILERTQDAAGIIDRNLRGASDNVIDQSARMATAMREAGEAFARPVNRAIADLIEFQLDDKEKGGLGLGAFGAVAATGGLLLGAGIAGKAAGGLLKNIPIIGGAAADAATTAAGLAQGQMLKQAGLATPVFVTNFPASLGESGGAASAIEGAAVVLAGKSLLARLGLTTAAGIGSAALGTAGVLAAGAGGYELGGAINRNFIEGTVLGDQIGRLATTIAALWDDDARAAIDARNKEPSIKLQIQLDDRGARVARVTSTGKANVDFKSGPLGLGASQ